MRKVLVLAAVIFAVSPLNSLTIKEQNRIVDRARLEVTRQVQYDASYRQLKYPGGDVVYSKGVCADVVVRAYRSVGWDLQKLIHQDRVAHPRAYGGGRADANIDQRRCRLQIIFWKRYATTLTKKADLVGQWKAGDVVYWDLTGGGLLHTGIISSARNRYGTPLVIHNIGPVAAEEDVLSSWKIIAHFRLK